MRNIEACTCKSPLALDVDRIIYFVLRVYGFYHGLSPLSPKEMSKRRSKRGRILERGREISTSVKIEYSMTYYLILYKYLTKCVEGKHRC